MVRNSEGGMDEAGSLIATHRGVRATFIIPLGRLTWYYPQNGKVITRDPGFSGWGRSDEVPSWRCRG
jgi:hypothetical protein